MSLNKEYVAKMEAGVKQLVENSAYDKVTNHAVFDKDKVELPKGVTLESMETHVNFLNDLTAQTETAVSQIARTEFGNNDKLTTVDGTLDFGFFSINSQHHLQQQVGDEHLYGQSTTAIDYVHSDEQAQWVADQRQASLTEAAKLFG